MYTIFMCFITGCEAICGLIVCIELEKLILGISDMLESTNGMVSCYATNVNNY